MKTALHSRATPWRERLLHAQLTPAEREALPREVQALGRAFEAGVQAPPAPESIAQANRWYHSNEGQATLEAVTRHLWTVLAPCSQGAMPAHDARHAIFKVPAAALEYLHAEDVQGYERVGVLGALLHDYGRWAEEHIMGQPGAGVFHARLSFLLAQEALTAFALPALVRQSVLQAVLGHSSGAHPYDPMPLKLTVAGDRDQLYGAEIALRLAHHSVLADGGMSSFYGETPGLSVLDRLEHFCRNRVPGPLFARTVHVLELQRTLYRFLLLSEDAPRSAQRWQNKGLPPGALFCAGPHWEREWHEAQALAGQGSASPTPRDALAQFLSAPHLTPDPAHIAVALDKVALVTDDLAPHLIHALDWGHRSRIAEDARQTQALRSIHRAYEGDALVRTLSALLLAHA